MESVLKSGWWWKGSLDFGVTFQMAQTGTSEENSATVKSTRSGVEILDEIKSHHFVYKKSKEDAEGFVKMLDMLRRNYSFTDVAISVKVNETFFTEDKQ